METLLHWDTVLFHWINSGWSNPVFDILMPFARNKYGWIPLYVLCLAWIVFNFSGRNIAYILAFVTVSIFASDTISSKLIKYQVQRPRPCHEQQLEPQMILRVSCGSGYSFTSSHAANHFCLAAFLVTLFGSYMKRWKYLWWVWALFISLAQVYVGLHYPFDILGGAVLGMIIGFSMGILCKHRIEKVSAVSS
ncbi:MAG TPA: phosphatase PAP2 family protein [Saprospiraceae bacterium]